MSDVLLDLPDDGYSDVSIVEFVNNYYGNRSRSGTYILFFFAAVIQRPEGEHFREMVRVLREVPSGDRDIDVLLTDRNLRACGLIEQG